MKALETNILQPNLRPSKTRKFIIFTLALVVNIYSNPVSASRFDPPSIKTHIENFDSRIDSDIFNVDFLLAHILNNSRKVVREIGEQTDGTLEAIENTAIFTNDNNGDSGTSAGSVVIPPGVSADTIIVINNNEGDSIAINR